MIEGGHQTEPMGITPDLSAWWNYNPSPAIFFYPVCPDSCTPWQPIAIVPPFCCSSKVYYPHSFACLFLSQWSPLFSNHHSA